MKDFLKKHRLLIIIPGVVVAFIAAAVIWALTGGRETGEDAGQTPAEKELLEKDYFTDQNYPVNVKEEPDGSLTVTADGSLTPELSWDYEVKDKEIIQAETISDQDGVISIRVSPLAAGYATVTLLREGKESGISYTAAKVDVNMLVTLYDDGTMSVSMSDIYQTSSYSGAGDSDAPFLIEGSNIILPSGGDWEVSETTASGGEAYGLFDIVPGMDDAGRYYIGVYTDVEPYLFSLAGVLEDLESGTAADEERPDSSLTDEEKETVGQIRDARLLIQSESLGKSYILIYQIDDQNQGLLKVENKTENDGN